MSRTMCTCCPMRKAKPMIPVEDGPRGVRVCPSCDGGAFEIVTRRDQAR